MVSKQRHDPGRQKRMKALPAMKEAMARRFAAKQRRLTTPLSQFMQDWLKYNKYRPYPGAPKDDN